MAALYGIGLYLGSQIIANRWNNSNFDRIYTVGDILAIVNAIMNGIFTILFISPALNSFFDARSSM